MNTTFNRGPEESYAYVDENNALLFTVHRWPGKKFSQQPTDGRTGPGAMRGVRLVPYRLPALVAATTAGHAVYVVEGERDVHAAEAAGVVATCNPGGALKWRTEYAECLRGASAVVIVADRDASGHDHARQVAATLDGIADYRFVQAASGKDLADHLGEGLTIEQLEPIALDRPSERAPSTSRDPKAGDTPLAPRHDRDADPLLRVDPRAYVFLLTGRQPDSRGKILCPLHEERTPSFHVYPTPEGGWHCFGCGRGGSVYDLAIALWNYDGPFSELRRTIAMELRAGSRG